MLRKSIYLSCFVVLLGLAGTNVAFAVEFDIRIAAGEDDAEEHVANGNVDLTSTDLELAYEDAGNPTTDEQIIGLRFANIPLPSGAQITSAYVEFEVDAVNREGTEYPVNLVVQGHLTPDAAPFVGIAYDLSNRDPLTAAKVKWSVPNWTTVDEKWQSSDISAIIQEIVDQDGWSTGNALVLMFRDDTDNSSTGLREAEAYDGEAPAAPLLHITAIVKKAFRPDPPDGAETVIMPLMEWMAGDTATFHDVYFGTNPTLGPAEFRGRQRLGMTMYVHGPGLIPGATHYWRIDEVEADGTTTHTGDVWSFTATPLAAYNPDPPDGTRHVATDVVLSWDEGFTAIMHDVYLGTDETEVADGTGGTFKGRQPGTAYTTAALQGGTIYYWRIDEVEGDGATKQKGDIWSFETIPDRPITDPNLIGWWKLDEGYAGTTLDWSGYGNDGSVIDDPQWVAGIMGGALQLDVNDFVAVDDVADDITSNNITLSGWIKTTDGDADWFSCNDSGRGNVDCIRLGILGGNAYVYDAGTDEGHSTVTVNDDRWHMLTYTRDGSTGYIYVDALLENTHVADFNVVDANNLWSIGQEWDTGGPSDFLTGLVDDVRIYDRALTQAEIVQLARGDLLLAWNPKPADWSTLSIEQATPLSWSPGDQAARHDVYFGTDKDAVADADTSTTGIYRGRQDPNNYTPPEGLELGQTYYWRIDQYNTDATISQGRLWIFTVADHLILDDFEPYDDFCNRVFYTWPDGWGHSGDAACGVQAYGGNGTGSTVGYLAEPYAEQAIVNSGLQSMPMEYNNSGSTGKVFYSETERTFEPAQDWTGYDVKALTLYFRGYPPSGGSFSEDPRTRIFTVTAGGTDIWNVPDFAGATAGNYHDEFHYAFKQLSGVGAIEARVLSVQNTNGWAKAGVMIRETLDANSPHAMVVMTPANGVALQYRGVPGGTSTDVSQAGITAPHWVRITRSANTFMGEHSVDGLTWEVIDTATIPMAADVYVGLALTSHSAGLTCEATLSDVTITGTVTGQWQSQDIGIASNDAEQLYVVVQDSTGTSKVVNHPDPCAVQLDTWQQWNIDLKQVRDAGVNLQSVRKMYIGVGSRDAPELGGTGMLYIDDIRLYPPRCLPHVAKPDGSFNNDCVVDYADIRVLTDDWLFGPGANGLQYEQYEGNWNALPDFDALLPVRVGRVGNFDISQRTQDDYFAFRFTGQISVATAGAYTFYTTSDDGSQLYAGDTLVVDNDGTHGMVEQSGTISLTAGMHPITVTMFERAGGEGLDVEYEGPRTTRQPIPDGVLYRLSSVADLNGDGTVDVKDYALMADMFLDEVLWP